MRKNDKALAQALAMMSDLVPEKDLPTLVDRALQMLHASGTADTSAFVHQVMKALELSGRILFAELATPTGSVGSERKASITAALTKKFGKTVVVTEKADPTLLGGATLRIGDELFELSLKDEIHRIAVSSPTSL